MYTSACLFVDGEHVKPGPNCPHGPDNQDMGEEVAPGWTVQQAN